MHEITTFAEFHYALVTNAAISIPSKKNAGIVHAIFGCCFRKKEDDPIQIARFFADELSILEVRRENLFGLCLGVHYEVLGQAIEAMKIKLLPMVRKEEKHFGIDELTWKRDDLLFRWRANGQGLEELKKVTDELGKKMMLAEAHRLVGDLTAKRSAMECRRMGAAVPVQKIRNEQEDWLTNAILFWRATHFPEMPGPLSDLAKKKIKECSRYPHLIPRLQREPIYAREFFEFAFRNVLDDTSDAVAISAEFPTIMTRLRAAFIDKRICRLSAPILRFVGGLEKDVLLQFEGHFVSLRDETLPIQFSTGLIKTIGQIFDSFALKNTIVGDFECLQQGIIHFPPKRPPVNLVKKEWWKDFASFETLTKAELEKRYRVELKPEQGIIAIHASRQHLQGIRFDGSHSWFETAVPDGKGSYQIIPIGKYPDVEPYPTGPFETLFYTYATWPAYINYPDENTFYNHREHIAVPHIASPEAIARWLEKVGSDLQSERARKLFFQSQGENCSVWLQETLDHAFRDKKLPRYFEVDFTEAQAPPPLNHLTNFYKFAAKKVSRSFANVIRVSHGFILGAWRSFSFRGEKNERIAKRLVTNPRWYTGRFSIPSMLFLTAKKGEVPVERKEEK
jgi:hypothetical protein